MVQLADTSLYPDLNLLLAWPERRSFRSWSAIAAVALTCQAVFFAGLLGMANLPNYDLPEQRVILHKTPLYLPPDLLTQKAPNRARPSQNIDLASLMPSRAAKAQAPAPPPSVHHFEVPKASPVAAPKSPEPQVEAPSLAQNQQPASLPPGVANGISAPEPAAAPSPFQDVGSDDGHVNPHPTLRVPKGTVEDAIKSLAQSPEARHLIVTDNSFTKPRPGSIGSSTAPGTQHMEVELQSDAQAPDFRDYLARVLTVVRANWRRVTPESVRLGTLRGQNTVELIINRDGQIPKLVIGQPSNVEALDRASVAGVSMSNPLPPLPDDFKGQQVRLAFTFKYNVQE